MRSQIIISLIAITALCSIASTAEEVNETSHEDVKVMVIDNITIPLVDFEDISPHGAIEFIRQRYRELTLKPFDHTYRNVQFTQLQDPKDIELGAFKTTPTPIENPINFKAKNIKLFDALSEIAKQGKLDVYHTTSGILFLKEGTKPPRNTVIVKPIRPAPTN